MGPGELGRPEMSRNLPEGLLRDESDRGSRVVEGDGLDSTGEDARGGRPVGRGGREEGRDRRYREAGEQPCEGTWRIYRPLI